MATVRLRDTVTGLIQDHPADQKDDLLAMEGGPDGARYEVVPEGKSAADYDRERDEAEAKEIAKAEKKAATGGKGDSNRADSARS